MKTLHIHDRPLIALATGGKMRLPRQVNLYVQAITAAGAKTVFVGPQESVKDAVSRCAGFLIPGGRDIDPLLYNEERIDEFDFEETRKVAFDIALLDLAVRRGKPVLGICYGMQLINVALGGTLYQDIAIQLERTVNHREGSHGVKISNNPFFDAGNYEVNSYHHQAVKSTGTGLETFALSADGVIEAFYAPGHCFLLGVQWHPERMENRISETVFKSFIGACLEHI